MAHTDPYIRDVLSLLREQTLCLRLHSRSLIAESRLQLDETRHLFSETRRLFAAMLETDSHFRSRSHPPIRPLHAEEVATPERCIDAAGQIAAGTEAPPAHSEPLPLSARGENAEIVAARPTASRGRRPHQARHDRPVVIYFKERRKSLWDGVATDRPPG